MGIKTNGESSTLFLSFHSIASAGRLPLHFEIADIRILWGRSQIIDGGTKPHKRSANICCPAFTPHEPKFLLINSRKPMRKAIYTVRARGIHGYERIARKTCLKSTYAENKVARHKLISVEEHRSHRHATTKLPTIMKRNRFLRQIAKTKLLKTLICAIRFLSWHSVHCVGSVRCGTRFSIQLAMAPSMAHVGFG